MLWLVILKDVSGKTKFRPVVYPQITNQTFIKQYVDAHNNLRSEVNPTASSMRYMTWDLALARTARAWGRRCVFLQNHFGLHNEGGHPDPKFNPPGENLWIANAGRKPFDPTGFITLWYSEVAFYQYHNNSCKGKCSHYTQVVWDTSYKIGCAIVFCRKLGRHRNIENFVCNYAPRGNAPRHPYKTGEPCSACPEGDTCENNLCRNPKRERERVVTCPAGVNIKVPYLVAECYLSWASYTRWFPPWEGRIVCDKSCVAVAVLRPSLMFLAFGLQAAQPSKPCSLAILPSSTTPGQASMGIPTAGSGWLTVGDSHLKAFAVSKAAEVSPSYLPPLQAEGTFFIFFPLHSSVFS
ncbi:GLIPR1-like protein 1 [Eublepharis macularius]|uniref:GLIPR1-like protein 1 n=1 Tax=Eublepharis macularius TaxID=481883 RepID=A0AA97L6M6_EUBMA|nr:GLIPR1-like protein 1 [Eublepharis macularius]